MDQARLDQLAARTLVVAKNHLSWGSQLQVCRLAECSSLIWTRLEGQLSRPVLDSSPNGRTCLFPQRYRRKIWMELHYESSSRMPAPQWSLDFWGRSLLCVWRSRLPWSFFVLKLMHRFDDGMLISVQRNLEVFACTRTRRQCCDRDLNGPNCFCEQLLSQVWRCYIWQGAD